MSVEELEFSHYERCFDSEGWMYIKAWYVGPDNTYVCFIEDEIIRSLCRGSVCFLLCRCGNRPAHAVRRHGSSPSLINLIHSGLRGGLGPY